MTDQNAIALMDRFWSSFHALPEAIGKPGVHVGLRPPGGQPCILLLERGYSTLVSGPSGLVAWLCESIPEMPDPLTAASWSTIPGHQVDRIIGPAYLGFLGRNELRPEDYCHETRVLTKSDHPAIDGLRKACDPVEWEHGGMDDDHVFLRTGAFCGGQLAAAGSCQKRTDHLADIGIVTHPSFRRQGYGTAAAAKAAQKVTNQGFLPFWRTLLTNKASLRTARRLGFVDYALTLSVRLTGDDPCASL